MAVLFVSDIIYGVKIPKFAAPFFLFHFSNLIEDCFFFASWWGDLGEKRQMVSFAKGKLRDHTYIFQLCGKSSQDSCLKCLVRRRHRGVPERVRPATEGSAINCRGLIQQQNMGVITPWQLSYFSLTEFQTCPVH